VDDALALVEKSFRESTVGELLRETSASVPLCPILPPPKDEAGDSPGPEPR
jgi:hypothetical protein